MYYLKSKMWFGVSNFLRIFLFEKHNFFQYLCYSFAASWSWNQWLGTVSYYQFICKTRWIILLLQTLQSDYMISNLFSVSTINLYIYLQYLNPIKKLKPLHSVLHWFKKNFHRFFSFFSSCLSYLFQKKLINLVFLKIIQGILNYLDFHWIKNNKV